MVNKLAKNKQNIFYDGQNYTEKLVNKAMTVYLIHKGDYFLNT